MDTDPKLRETVEKACTLHPSQRARIEAAARGASELDSAVVRKAFEHALRRVLHARSPADAGEKVDALERALVAWPASRGFRCLREAERVQRKLALAFAALAIVAFAVGLIAAALE